MPELNGVPDSTTPDEYVWDTEVMMAEIAALRIRAEAADAVFATRRIQESAAGAAAQAAAIADATLIVRSRRGMVAADTQTVQRLPEIEDPELTVCAVCLDDENMDTTRLRLPCGHLFHPGCVKQWFTVSNSCPLCKTCLPAAAVLPTPVVDENNLQIDLIPTGIDNWYLL
ncbi:hypothetical protein SARC_12141 [Sphaeroforma arctica JP610]|uniref:RING-type domain-containing protein n=1 Tax=Sphaeroforma arctica JP610 TaxID=667725 RepID=A0A0L0FFS0_9EUKA|nr:hypothetical protein SARC_12141 [Sphaeroforma arctica JP610]KNC75326.1 hypothetical protein SARC_12141 [Sphaeroforma arctica JP610]|eukprot:XP_014149228.1 hypothetical protein SARC_12141 [Sphaeroforma arctica JP610]